MNFLTPWFLLGAAAVAGPVVFHLIRRSARVRTVFSSVLFLRPVPPRSTRKRQLEHIVLLLLRCLALLFLAFAFARPFFPTSDASPPPSGDQRQTVLLLDTSASMRRTGLWSKAVAVASQYLEKAQPGDRFAVLTFDQQTHPLISFAEWLSWPADQRAVLARQKLAAVSPSWGGTALGPALTEAAELFQEDAHDTDVNATRVVTLISDLQEGASLEGLQGHEWPKGVGVQIERIDPAKRGNAGLEILDTSRAAGAADGPPRVRVVNARDSDRENFTLRWGIEKGTNVHGQTAPIYLPPGQTRTFAAPTPPAGSSNDSASAAMITTRSFAGPPLPDGATIGAVRLVGDDEDFDNNSWFATPAPELVSVAYFGIESANDPAQLRYYLDRALDESGRREVAVVTIATNSVVDAAVLNRIVALAVIPAELGAEQAAAVRQWLVGGKTALLVLTNVLAAPTLAALAPVALWVSEAPDGFALIGEVDFNHPIFAPFADPKFSDFSRIHFWRHRLLNLPTNFPGHILAKFDDGSPALVQMPVGKGNLLVLASGWNPADSQFALSTKFLPFLQNILDWSGGAAPTRTQFQIGDTVPAPSSAGGTTRWTKPDSKTVDQPAGAPFTGTDLPGIYLVTTANKTNCFAVNLPLDESRTAPMSPDDLGRLGVPLQNLAHNTIALTPAAKHVLLRAEMENRQKVWRWFLAALLGVAFIEVILAGWLARRLAPPEAAA